MTNKWAQENLPSDYQSTEWQLLVHLCRKGLSNESQPISIHSLEKADWPQIFKLAHIHRVRPLVNHGLVNSEVRRFVPQTVLKKFKEAHVQRNSINMRHAMELKPIIKLLAEKGVKPILYKGLILGQYAYDNISLREISDIDMLIDLKDFSIVEELILSRNYVPTVEMTDSFRPIYFKQNSEYNFDLYEEGKRVCHIEPHWRIGAPRWQTDFGYKDILPLTKPANFLGETINQLTPEGLLITTSLHHGGEELWKKLKHICDIAAILLRSKDEINWQNLFAKTDELKVTNIVLLGIALSVRLFASPVPEEVRQIIQTSKIRKHADKIEAKLKRTGRQKNVTTYLEQLYFHIDLRNSWSTKARVVYHHFIQIFTPTIFDHRDDGNSDKKYWQLFVSRPIRIWRQHFKRGK
jgi:hypothetical protein